MEAVILYFVLFFPSYFSSAFSAESALVESVSFSALRELGRTLTYSLPSLALLWYLITEKKGFFGPQGDLQYSNLSFSAEQQGFPEFGIPRRRDLIPFAVGLPVLVLIGLGISFLVSFFYEFSGLPPKIEGPVTVSGWIIMVFSCIFTGYLEESYFRYYLLSKLENLFSKDLFRILISTFLFSLCHLYEGPWGILNAVLAGILLSVLFVRYRSLHGVAWAHGAYNIFVYMMGSFGF